MKNLILLFTFIFFLLNCSTEGRKRLFKRKEKSIYTPSFIHLPSLLTNEEDYISFPNWFNDSIIENHKIERITRKSFLEKEDVELTENQHKSFTLRGLKEYYFTEKGNISKLIIRNYYDEKEIGSHIYSYEKEKFPKQEFFKTKLEHVFYPGIENKEEDEFFDENLLKNPYKIVEKIDANNLIKQYQNIETGDYLYYVLSPEYWGALSIDSLISPNPKDEIVLGSPNHFYKKYQVTNKVNEFNVRTYTYDDIHPKKVLYWEVNHYPFKQKRNFIYNNQGICYAYIDSVFSNDQFVTKTKSNIHYNPKSEPISITHLKSNKNGDTLFTSKDVFEYLRK